jgi:hypothetical protein
MRWLFADPSNAEEAAAVKQRIAAIDHWWQQFQTSASKFENYLKRTTRFDLAAFMEETLQAIDPRLMWEFGPAVRQSGHRLVITPESARYLRPMVRTLLERAPKIAGWEFYPYRLAESAEKVLETVKGRIGADVTGAQVAASIAPGRKVDLCFTFPEQPDLDAEAAGQAAFVATESLVGEQVLDTWIGAIEVELDPAAMPQALPLASAQGAVAGLIRGLLEQLPPGRAKDIGSDCQWSSIELESPEPADDYPGRDDLLVASTNNIELFQAMHSGQPFASSCHSRVGETFGYLKIDTAGQPSGEIVKFRGQFEDALHPALVAANGGGVIGGGSGLRYAYIDLALLDVKRAVPVIRQVLSDCRAPLRSWLLFHDDDLAAEWIGIYRQTPPPPLAGDRS